MDLRPHSLQLELASEPSASAAVRFSMDELGLPASAAERARLLASELVTNSVRHAGAGPEAPISISVHVDPARLRVAVEDVGQGEVRMCPDAVRAAGSGYGLFLVDAVSDRWGASNSPQGTTVWFELDLSHSA